MSTTRSTDLGDEWVDRLSQLFREHPAWTDAARHLTPDATSTVYFSQRPGEAWRLERVGADTCLLPGVAADPDLVFRFTPRSVERLENADGSIGDFAVALFALIEQDEVEFRIAAGFQRLAARGYVKLLLVAGLPVLRFGAQRGVRSVGALRRIVTQIRAREPADWENAP